MITRLRQAIDTAAVALAQAGIDSARIDAELLAAHFAGVDRGRLSLTEPSDPGFFDCFEAAVRTRARRIPLQHITGTAAFGPVHLHVGPGVFIPRPETEALLEWALHQPLPDSPVIVDLCTGSGALAVALATERPDARVIAVDDDPVALRYARRNAPAAVRVLQADVADPGVLSDLAGTVDLVVANPPYIPTRTAHAAVLEPEVAEHDPAHALYGGPDGMAVISPVVARAADWLTDGGLLAVEHDDTTSAATVEVMRAAGVFEDVTPHRDLTGRPRFVTARRTRRGGCR
jgi:release factor glutamine methyltransferase